MKLSRERMDLLHPGYAVPVLNGEGNGVSAGCDASL